MDDKEVAIVDSKFDALVPLLLLFWPPRIVIVTATLKFTSAGRVMSIGVEFVVWPPATAETKMRVVGAFSGTTPKTVTLALS